MAADDYQGAADAILTKSLGIKKVFILNDKEAYGLGVATNFKNAAKKLGLKIVGFTAWDGKASSYEALAVKIKASGAQGVFLGGLICENGGKLIKDIRAGAPNVKIMLPDGFTPVSATVQQSRDGGRGRDRLGRRSAEQRRSRAPARRSSTAFTKADQRAAGSVLGVRGTGGRGRSSRRSRSRTARVPTSTKQLFKIKLKGSILGNVSFNSNGDVTSNPVTIYKVKGGKSTTFKVIVPPKSLVKAA